MGAAASAASKVADLVRIKCIVPTGHKAIEGDGLIPCFSCPCFGIYCSPHQKCGCAGTNQFLCCTAEMQPTMKLLKCGKEELNFVIEILCCFKFLFKKPEPIFAIKFEGWTPKNRSIVIASVETSFLVSSFTVPDGLGCYRPGCSKNKSCRLQNKCFCCVQQAGYLSDSHQACACFGLACLPGTGCCKSVGHLVKKKSLKEEKQKSLERKMEEKQASPKASPKSSKKNKKDKKVKLKVGVDKKEMFQGVLGSAL